MTTPELPRLELTNTLTGEKAPFEPADPERVTMYVCGPTVYNFVHIGNGRPAVVFDVLYRYLQRRYPKVIYARNVTDIDDRINQAGLDEGVPIQTIADRFTAAYLEDVAALGVLTPDVEPRATHHIEEIIGIIDQLIDGGHAYAAAGHVLFDVHSDASYGVLSRRTIEDMIAGARVEPAPYKKHPADFVLWKPSTPELPGWDSPWGRGRPGWHIECTAMIRKHLGHSIDIHGGGSDLIFPHHENEIAQGVCSCPGEPYVRVWLHNGMLTIDGEKMSKSLGNFVTIRDLLGVYRGEVLRYALLRGQYRSSLAWGTALLDEAQAALDRLYQALRAAALPPPEHDADAPLPPALEAALCDDLNTAGAIAALHELVGDFNRSEDTEERRALALALRRGGAVLGLLQQDPEAWFTAGDGLDIDRIETLVAARTQAKKDRDYARADAIRDELHGMGIEIEDSREGTRWRVIGSGE